MDRLYGMGEHSRPLVFNTQHLGDVGAMEVQIEQADLLTMVRKGKSKVYRDGGFSHTAFPAQHEDDVFDINLRFWR
jgi:hypothetical protein